MKRHLKTHARTWAVTLLELMIVVLILSILSTIAVGVYTGKTQEARIAAAHALIHNLEVAITRYEIDTGSLPPSGSGGMPVGPTSGRNNGSGYLHEVLVHGVNGNAYQPGSNQWKGPYINLQVGSYALKDSSGNINPPGLIDILDPWGMPILYTAWPEYATTAGNYTGGTVLFTGAAPDGANLSLAAPSPYSATETYYNPRTFQLISYGPDATTLAPVTAGGVGFSYAGAAADDITNFGN